MEQVQQFLEHPNADLIMFVLGAILAFFCFIQIVRKGAALMLYLVLFIVGMFPVMYAFKGSDADFLANARDRVSEYGGLVPGIKDDVLAAWCTKLDEAGL